MSTSKRTILFLGDSESPLLYWLKENEKSILHTSEKIDPDFIKENDIYFLVSFGYRHIIRKEILDLLPNRAINLHISYLPWNRGADPNLWSFIEGTPKGVTIHYIDEGIDTGDILVQRKVELDEGNDTLATSYEKLQLAIQKLFIENWNDIVNGCCSRSPQVGPATQHKLKDKKLVEKYLTDGWETPVSRISMIQFTDKSQ